MEALSCHWSQRESVYCSSVNVMLPMVFLYTTLISLKKFPSVFNLLGMDAAFSALRWHVRFPFCLLIWWIILVVNLIWLFKKDFVYLFMKDTHTQRQRHRQREKQASCRDPDAGLDPGTLGSWPELKADAQPLSYPGVPNSLILNQPCIEPQLVVIYLFKYC